MDDTDGFSKAVQLQVQGQWTRWRNYVQQDFSWASLMAMPANLTSFCLASTYDTLPSPTNLKRWRITTETMCTVCSKDVCTTAHILGAGKIYIPVWQWLVPSQCSPQNFHSKYKRSGTYFFGDTFKIFEKRSKSALQKESTSCHFTSCIKLGSNSRP